MTIYEVKGDIFHYVGDAIVIPTNSWGVAGRGLALQAKEKLPGWYDDYRVHPPEPGQVISWSLPPGRLHHLTYNYVISASTKRHWRDPSKLIWVTECCRNIQREMAYLGIARIAIPSLGAGLGKLEWEDIRAVVLKEFKRTPNLRVTLYFPLGKEVS